MKRTKLFFVLLILAALLAGCSQDAPAEEFVLPTFQLELTPEQAQQFDSGAFYLMRQFGEDRFARFYASECVRLEGNQLVADFNGKVLYFINDTGLCSLIEMTHLQTQDGVACYQTYFNLAGYTDKQGAAVTTNTRHDIFVAYDEQTCALVNSRVFTDYNVEETDLLHAEVQPLELPDAKVCDYRPGTAYRYISRDENGVVLPFREWDSLRSANVVSQSGSGATLFYGDLAAITTLNPLDQGKVVLVFEVTLKDGTSWCSEPMDVPLRKNAAAPNQPEPTQPLAVNWTDGNRICLTDADDYSIFLRRSPSRTGGGISYALELKNDSETELELSAEQFLINGKILCQSPLTLSADPGKWVSSTISFGALAEEAPQTPVQTLSFPLTMELDFATYVFQDLPVEVTLAPDLAITPYWAMPTAAQNPCKEFLAQENQLLLEQDGIRFTLLYMGDTGSTGHMTWLVRAENICQESRIALFGGALLNDTFFSATDSMTLEPGQIYYYEKAVYRSNMDESLHQDIYSATLLLGACKDTIFARTTLCPVTAAAAAPKAEVAPPEGELIFEAQQFRIYLQNVAPGSYKFTDWQLLLENTGDENMTIQIRKSTLAATDGTEEEIAYPQLNKSFVPAHSRIPATLSCSTEQPLLVWLRLLTEDENTILHTEKDPIFLPMP